MPSWKCKAKWGVAVQVAFQVGLKFEDFRVSARRLMWKARARDENAEQPGLSADVSLPEWLRGWT